MSIPQERQSSQPLPATGSEEEPCGSAGRISAFHPVLFCFLAIAIAWTAWAPLLAHVREAVELPVPFPVALFVCQTLGAFAPLLSLCVIQRLRSEPDLVEHVLKKIRFRKVSFRWFLLPSLTPLAIATLSAAAQQWVSSNESVPILNPVRVEELGWGLLFVVPFTFVVAMIGSPFGEEPGWRGYLLKGFLVRRRGLMGSGIVAVVWWVWHVPLFLVLGVEPSLASFLEMLGYSLLIDSFFILSGHNLLCAMLFHQGVSINFMFFNSQTQTPLGLLILLGLALCIRSFAFRQPARMQIDRECPG